MSEGKVAQASLKINSLNQTNQTSTSKRLIVHVSLGCIQIRKGNSKCPAVRIGMLLSTESSASLENGCDGPARKRALAVNGGAVLAKRTIVRERGVLPSRAIDEKRKRTRSMPKRSRCNFSIPWSPRNFVDFRMLDCSSQRRAAPTEGAHR